MSAARRRRRRRRPTPPTRDARSRHAAPRPPRLFPRAVKEEHLHDYNVRKGNVDAAEKALWNEELALHS